MQVVNKDLSLNGRYFNISDTKYSIVGTLINLGKPDIVVNLQTGVTKKYNRQDLKTMTDKYKATIYKF